MMRGGREVREPPHASPGVGCEDAVDLRPDVSLAFGKCSCEGLPDARFRTAVEDIGERAADIGATWSAGELDF
jgi:hypothetical protein